MAEPSTEQSPEAAGEPSAVMSFWEHLDELRSRLSKAALAYVAAMFAAWAVREQVLAFLWMPFVASWKTAGLEGEPQLHFAARAVGVVWVIWMDWRVPHSRRVP